jgi:hypothetical protein
MTAIMWSLILKVTSFLENPAIAEAKNYGGHAEIRLHAGGSATSAGKAAGRLAFTS